jgi:hypothetical protein
MYTSRKILAHPADLTFYIFLCRIFFNIHNVKKQLFVKLFLAKSRFVLHIHCRWL